MRIASYILGLYLVLVTTPIGWAQSASGAGNQGQQKSPPRTAFSASSECRSTFDLISAPCAVKMSLKSSLPQSLHSVQLVLTGNTSSLEFAGPIMVPSAGNRLHTWRSKGYPLQPLGAVRHIESKGQSQVPNFVAAPSLSSVPSLVLVCPY